LLDFGQLKINCFSWFIFFW